MRLKGANSQKVYISKLNTAVPDMLLFTAMLSGLQARLCHTFLVFYKIAAKT